MKTMRIDYNDKKSDYEHNLVKKAQFLQRVDTRARVLDAFLAQIDSFFDQNTVDEINKQIDSLQNQFWKREVKRVTDGIKTRNKNKDKIDDSDNSDDDKTDNSDDDETHDNVITVNKSDVKFYPKKNNRNNRNRKQHAHTKNRRNQNHQ